MSIARETAKRLSEKIAETVSSRGDVYGTPEDNFDNIANLWNAYIGAKTRNKEGALLTAADVGQMCALMKIARLANSPTHEDSALDAAVYSLLGLGCAVDLSQIEAAKQ